MPHHNAKHGMYGTPTYNSWAAMKQRCQYEKSIEYHRYGARGITVCEAWQTFAGFFADMGVRPEGMTIERRESNGNYEPSNCKWATTIEQANNKRNNHVLEWGGESRTIAQWAAKLGISQLLIARRIRRGWTAEQALTMPIGSQVKDRQTEASIKTRFQPIMLTHNGETKSITDWALSLGFANSSALGKRLQAGQSLDVALSPPKRKQHQTK